MAVSFFKLAVFNGERTAYSHACVDGQTLMFLSQNGRGLAHFAEYLDRSAARDVSLSL
jgi:hypothetical protein